MKQATIDKLAVHCYPDRQEMGLAAARHTANIITRLLKERETLNIIFAAAPSQNDFLEALCQMESVPFHRINGFHMDEYIGLPATAPQRFGNFLRTRLFERRAFAAVHYIDGNAPDIDAECLRYAELLREYPPDIVCGGIGENGHIAFNDPPVADFHDLAAIKRVKLDEVCRQQQVNDGCFSSLEVVPTHALTLTIPTLFSATYQVFVVPSASKAAAVREMLYGPVSPQCPASILRRAGQCVLYLDADSASLLAPEIFSDMGKGAASI